MFSLAEKHDFQKKIVQTLQKESSAIFRVHVYNDTNMANVVHASLRESMHIKNEVYWSMP